MKGKVFSRVRGSRDVVIARNSVAFKAIGLVVAIDEDGHLTFLDKYGNVVAEIAHGNIMNAINPLRVLDGRYADKLAVAPDGVATIRFSDGVEVIASNGRYHGWAFVRDNDLNNLGEAHWSFAATENKVEDVTLFEKEEENA